MSYQKIGFNSGDILMADELNHMEAGIAANDTKTDGVANVIGYDSEAAPAPVMKTLTAKKFVQKYLWHVKNKYEYGPVNRYKYAEYQVKPGVTYYVTGSAPTNTNAHPLGAWYDAEGEYLSSFGTDPNTVYTDYEVTAPENAAEMYVNCDNAATNIKVVGAFVYTGATAIDSIISDISTVQDDITTLYRSVDEMQAKVTVGPQVSPVETADGLFNVLTKTVYQTGSSAHAKYDAGEGYYFVTGTSASNVSSYPLVAFFDENWTLLDSDGLSPATAYNDYLCKAPATTAHIVVQRNWSTGATIILKKGIASETGGTGAVAKGYNLNVASELLRLERRNPFVMQGFPAGMVSFVVDDLLPDLDSIASVFAEFNYPVCIAAIPDRLDMTATYLTEASGDYTPGMSMREIMNQVVTDGGEIMVHNSAPVVTVDNQDNFDFMYGYFVTSLTNLQNAGFNPEGIIRAGGTGAISGTDSILKWLVGNYRYSNLGVGGNLPQYAYERTTIQKSVSDIKAEITAAKTNKTWLRYMVHGYDFGEGQTFTGPEDLREILTHCQTEGIQVVTYKTVFDTYGN